MKLVFNCNVDSQQVLKQDNVVRCAKDGKESDISSGRLRINYMALETLSHSIYVF